MQMKEKVSPGEISKAGINVDRKRAVERGLTDIHSGLFRWCPLVRGRPLLCASTFSSESGFRKQQSSNTVDWARLGGARLGSARLGLARIDIAEGGVFQF